ncbi:MULTISPECIES: hypothetical protein [Protofrankia]|uniref:Uncharacterized protein n=1 Tax=Candidatus Protofrankia datiscae TaxID=2716812 RepID=F8B5S5_9ACTN|nr:MULTISPECIES: hypothetical protein [Protofrankia]AEH10164.1 hypothetical protein FsymDg_2828 [Candidatus Protofrankia datiscae]
MSVRCQEGHLSRTHDWCDQCGIPIAAESPPPKPGVVLYEPGPSQPADAAAQPTGSVPGVRDPSGR